MADKKKDDKKGQGPTPTEEMFGEVLGILQSGHDMKKEDIPENLDPEKVMDDLRSTLDSLRKEADRLSEQTGMSREEMDTYSQNPENFTEEEWKMLTQIREELETYRAQAHDISDTAPMVFGGESASGVEMPKRKKGSKRKGWMQL